MTNWWEQWSPEFVTLNATTPDDAWKICVLQGVYFGENSSIDKLGTQISAIFVILITSLIATLFPVVARRSRHFRVPDVVYLIAKMFGTGVIVATAFIHLMDPAYSEIGSNSCVGSTGHWEDFPWCPTIMLASAVVIFLVDTYCDFFAKSWCSSHDNASIMATNNSYEYKSVDFKSNLEELGVIDLDETSSPGKVNEFDLVGGTTTDGCVRKNTDTDPKEINYYSQFTGFLILELGVVLHSVMIGLTFGTSDNYRSLYPVIIFHQAFEGLGIGARLSAIPFPRERKYIPYVLCILYALTTPISIAIGLGVRKSYRDTGFNSLIVQGVLNAISAGILLYTGFVELLARDFIFNPERTKSIWMLNLQLLSFLCGAGLMTLLGKWA